VKAHIICAFDPLNEFFDEIVISADEIIFS